MRATAEGNRPEAADGEAGAAGLPRILLRDPVTFGELDVMTPSTAGARSVSYVNRDTGFVYESVNGIVDLTLESRLLSASETRGNYEEASRGPGVDVFQSPLVSFLYERGWRQSFARAGFPGVEREFADAMAFLDRDGEPGGTLVDLSCGSGLFTRRFVSSGKFDQTVAIDLSQTMLEETRRRLGDDMKTFADGRRDPLLIRADVGRLPIVSNSVDKVHAGAALHCWPSPLDAAAEIYRILKPRGLFVATTFLEPSERVTELSGYDEGVEDLMATLSSLQKRLSRGVGVPMQGRSTIRYWRERELRQLLAAVGFTDINRKRSAQYIMITAMKPS